MTDHHSLGGVGGTAPLVSNHSELTIPTSTPRYPPIRVLLEAHILAAGRIDPSTKTGIHRVTADLVKGLAASPEVELRLCVPYILDAIDREAPGLLHDYVQAQLAGASVTLPSRRLSSLDCWSEAHHDPKTAPLRDALRDRWRGRPVDLRLGDRLDFYLAQATQGPVRRLRVREFEWHLDRADLYHTTFYRVPDAALRRGKPIVATIYDLIPVIHPELSSRSIVEWFTRSAEEIRHSTLFQCISECTRDDLCERWGVDPGLVTVSYPAADRDRFHSFRDDAVRLDALVRHGIPDEPYLLCVNTLEPRKNTLAVLEAFLDCAREPAFDGINLVLVGGRGWNDEELQARLGGSQPALARVLRTGFVEDLDLAALYSGALGFVYPSLYEGFGLPVLEAMQCGIPVITSNTSSLPEVAGDAGLLIDPLDPTALADAMLKLTTDSALRTVLASRSLQRAAMFTPERFIDSTVEIYRNARR